jgi:murein DD-endopeptidase MepM/ murein hydrolase activator NlpD
MYLYPGQVVHFNFTFPVVSGRTVRVGIRYPNGSFHGFSSTNGVIDDALVISNAGEYQLQIVNASSSAAQVTGRYTLGFLYPFRGSNPPTEITSGYGDRGDDRDMTNNLRFHPAFDIARQGIGGTPLYSIGTGTVRYVNTNAGGFGHYVVIELDTVYAPTGQKLRIAYAHLQTDSIKVVRGEKIDINKLHSEIARVGNTGVSVGGSGHHLHFAVITDGTNYELPDSYSNTINPMQLFGHINYIGTTTGTRPIWDRNSRTTRRRVNPNQPGGTVSFVAH